MINQFKEHLLEIMPALRGFAVSKTGDPMVADDVVQEACARMLDRAEDLTSRRVNLVAYGMRVVDNIITDHHRFGDRFREMSDDEWEQRADSQLDAPDFLVLKHLRKLSVNCQSLLLLVAQEWKHQEIANRTGQPIGTVSRSISECRERLGRFLGGRHG